MYLDYPRPICLLGVFRRVLSGRGRTRSDMGAGCPERLDWEFVRYVWDFRRTQRGKILSLLHEAQGVDVQVFRTRRAAARFLEQA